MLDRITSIQVFLAVARHGSFTEGAADLGMSRAMVSKHIKALETQLGVRLFNRNTRSINLTEEGLAYRDRVSPVLEALEDIETNIGDMSGKASGTLAIAAPTSFGLFHLSPVLASYMTRYPDVKVQLMLTDREVNLIDEGFDAAIQIRELDDSSLIARLLSDVEMVVCAAPRYLAANGEPRQPDDLAAHNCLVFSEIVHRDHGTWSFGGRAQPLAVRVEGDLVSNLGDALRIAAVAGRGIVRLPSYIVDEDIAAGRLQAILTDFEPQLRPIYIVYPHRDFLASKVRTFVDYLIAAFA